MTVPRLRQAVIAVRDLDAVVSELRSKLGLAEPYADPGVEHFGLRNAVFALGDTFLEVVSPVRPETAAGRLIDRRGGDCGYMTMFQVEDLAAARDRARRIGVREVFEISLEEIEEVHLHPADMRGAIVSLSTPRPASSWRWGGPSWEKRAVPGEVASVTISVADPATVAARWREVVGPLPGVFYLPDAGDFGLTEIAIDAPRSFGALQFGSVWLVSSR